MNLRERAHFAYLDRVAIAERELHDSAIVALRDVLADQTIDVDATKLAPFTAPAQAFYDVEGLTFRVSVKTIERKNDTGSNAGLAWEEVEIDVAVSRRQAFAVINNIGDLGQVFKDEPLPDEEAKAELDAADETAEAAS